MRLSPTLRSVICRTLDWQTHCPRRFCVRHQSSSHQTHEDRSNTLPISTGNSGPFPRHGSVRRDLLNTPRKGDGRAPAYCSGNTLLPLFCSRRTTAKRTIHGTHDFSCACGTEQFAKKITPTSSRVSWAYPQPAHPYPTTTHYGAQRPICFRATMSLPSTTFKQAVVLAQDLPERGAAPFTILARKVCPISAPSP